MLASKPLFPASETTMMTNTYNLTWETKVNYRLSRNYANYCSLETLSLLLRLSHNRLLERKKRRKKPRRLPRNLFSYWVEMPRIIICHFKLCSHNHWGSLKLRLTKWYFPFGTAITRYHREEQSFGQQIQKIILVVHSICHRPPILAS